jgi:hypothetical protein
MADFETPCVSVLHLDHLVPISRLTVYRPAYDVLFIPVLQCLYKTISSVSSCKKLCDFYRRRLAYTILYLIVYRYVYFSYCIRTCNPCVITPKEPCCKFIVIICIGFVTIVGKYFLLSTCNLNYYCGPTSFWCCHGSDKFYAPTNSASAPCTPNITNWTFNNLNKLNLLYVFSFGCFYKIEIVVLTAKIRYFD